MQRPILVVMGVSGSGKSTVGKLLAEQLHLPFYDGDDFHPAGNVAKMRAGIPLEDADRIGWLDRLHTLAKELLKKRGGVIACSALKESYRQVLSEGIAPQIKWILLEGDYDLIRTRMQSRGGHYMPVELLASQFATLEIPEYATRISIHHSPEHIVQQIMNTLSKSTIGIIGLGVMGRNLALNFAEKGFALSLYNRHVAGKEEDVAKNLVTKHEEFRRTKGFDDLALFVSSLEQPRRILLMVEAGNAVDDVIAQLTPLLGTGDVIADCGNSHFRDTERRQESLKKRGIYFLGTGVSGGEKGARFGPSIMPGGDREAYALWQGAFESIAAKDTQERPCCTYIGNGGAGHFVKMVHNGIEYAEMQLIAEVYGLLRHGYAYDPDHIAELFAAWSSGIHQSFLLDITIQILRKREGDGWLIDRISDAARSKGTGSWTLQAANDLGIPSPMIAAAVHARFLSAHVKEQSYEQLSVQRIDALPADIERIARAFYLARMINHHLGFALLREASKRYGWNLDLQEISRIWTNGCIIRSALMEHLWTLLPGDMLLHSFVQSTLQSAHQDLTAVVVEGTQLQLHLPCHSAALHFLNGYRIHQPTGNLTQAQRDYFGAHGFERVDDSKGKTYHGDW